LQIVIFDNEATGLETLQRDSGNNRKQKADEVIQFSAIVTDLNFKLKALVNRYCFTNMAIDPDIAARTHKLDPRTLYELSGGDFFEDVLDSVQHLWQGIPTIFVAYNINYDKGIMNATLANAGLPKMNFGTPLGAFSRNKPPGTYHVDAAKLLCSVLNRGNMVSQEQLISSKAGKSKEEMQKLFKFFISKFPHVQTHNYEYHNSLMDVFALWYLLNQNKGMIFA
jgi:hypothetical protein